MVRGNRVQVAIVQPQLGLRCYWPANKSSIAGCQDWPQPQLFLRSVALPSDAALRRKREIGSPQRQAVHDVIHRNAADRTIRRLFAMKRAIPVLGAVLVLTGLGALTATAQQQPPPQPRPAPQVQQPQRQAQPQTQQQQQRAEQPAQQPQQQPEQQPGQQPDQQPPRRLPQDNAATPQPRLNDDGVRLGVLLAPSPAGVLVRDVRPGGPADHAQIQAGDYLLSIGETKIDGEDAVVQALSQFREGDTAELVIWRDGQQRKVEVTFDPRFQRAFRQEFPAADSADQGDQRDTAWLGVTMRRFTPEAIPAPGQPQPQPQQQGVYLLRVYPSGPAARAGLMAGDVVIQADGQPVARPEDLADAVSQHAPGDTIELTVVRNGQQRQATARLGSLAAFFGESEDETQQPFLGDFRDDDISEHAMMLEQNRRFAEQHQRLEELVQRLHEEVRALRQELRGGRADDQQGASASQTPQTQPGTGTPQDAAPATPTPRAPDNRPNQGDPGNTRQP